MFDFFKRTTGNVLTLLTQPSAPPGDGLDHWAVLALKRWSSSSHRWLSVCTALVQPLHPPDRRRVQHHVLHVCRGISVWFHSKQWLKTAWTSRKACFMLENRAFTFCIRAYRLYDLEKTSTSGFTGDKNAVTHISVWYAKISESISQERNMRPQMTRVKMKWKKFPQTPELIMTWSQIQHQWIY